MKATILALVLLTSVTATFAPSQPPAPSAVLENGELMSLVLRPAYAELQIAMTHPPADRRERAERYQKAARLAEFANLLFFRSGPRTATPEWQAAAAAARDASAALSDALLAELGTSGAAVGDAVRLRAAYVAVSAACNACHRQFGRREAPVIAP